MREHPVQQAIMAYLHSLEKQDYVWSFRSNSFKGVVMRPTGGRGWLETGRPGCPDIIALLKGGKFLGIEVKGTDGRLSPAQRSTKNIIESLGGIYILAKSVDDVRDKLEELTNGV
jgi:hypothetical protein